MKLVLKPKRTMWPRSVDEEAAKKKLRENQEGSVSLEFAQVGKASGQQ